ncbi:MAG: hypothetical protein RBS16_06025 [Candidatus Cloacimonadales bacterium]|jgi:hypothetical protein|nr:hypothetical protein [Candidatus Cloacimonadales bacterium]
MGTQQILMIVLSVIIVGAAVAVGIQMFDTQATNSQRTAIAADIQNFGAQVLAFSRTPTSMGGGKGATNLKEAEANLAQYLGFTGTGNTLENVNAVYTLSVNANIATITGVQGTITATGEIDLEEKDVAKAISVSFSTTE